MDGAVSLPDINIIILWTSVGYQFLIIMVLASSRTTEAKKYIISALNGTLVYCLGTLLHSLGFTWAALSIGLKVQYVSAFFLTISLFMTFRQVYNENMGVVPHVLALLLILVVVIPILVAMPDGKGIAGLFYEKAEPVKYNGMIFLDIGFSWFRLFYVVVMVVILLMQLAVFIKSFLVARHYKYKVRHHFFYVAFFPQIIMLMDLMFGWFRIGVPVVPIASIVGATVSLIFVSKKKVTNLYDLSRSEVINSLKDPLFIIDNRFFVRYANNAAKVLFPEYKTLMDDSYRRLKACPELQNIIAPPIHETLSYEDDFLKIGKQIYEPELHRMGTNKSLQGYVITLNDVTEQQTRNDFLERQNIILSTTLRTARNRVLAERDKLISGTMQFVWDKNPDAADHMRRTSNYTFVIARELRRMGVYTDILTDSYMETLGQVAPLHDIGKFLVPNELLDKKDMNDEELKTMQSHVMLGMQMIDRMIVNNLDDLFYKLAHEVTLFHHEWWNGSGYPKGLVEEEIPLSARIVAVADVFDALSARHAQRNTYHFDEACGIVESFSGRRFDPAVVQAFRNAKEKLKELYDQVFQSGGKL